MNEAQTITDIRTTKNAIKEGIKKVDTTNYQGEKFGSESEYTYEDLLEGINSLLTDIATLIKAPVQFSKLSTYGERKEILDSLIKIKSGINHPHNSYSYPSLDQSLDQLKQSIRPFHIRHTKERLIEFNDEFNDELSEFVRKKQEFAETLNNLQQDLELTTKNKVETNKVLVLLQEQNSELESNIKSGKDRLDALNEKISNIENDEERISEIKNQYDKQKEQVDNFVKKIIKREQQIEDQTEKTNVFNVLLKEFTTQRDELLKTAQALIKEAKTALGYKKAEGISGAFKAQLEERDEGKKWLWFAGAFIMIAIGLTIMFIWKTQSVDLNTTLARISIISLPFSGAWFCAGQYTKLKNIAEDYAYKTMLAQSIIGFSEQLKSTDDSDTSYQDYMKKMLDEIHQHPLKNHKRQEKVNPYKKTLDDFKNLLSKNNKNKASE
ncbi:hypothetical protein [bacterium endosymbiont of Bathymodiolus sp. 5 South]|jgi:DNA repair exonuclease SbcCD ATPase subunit|uniref:hypothetical protein n=1 Tax=bacterium endosymbiont of Bathymodiolus sp. 5 South TaxID=1181670 RepID=UPI0010AEF79E|nr:hypothetical protein [bacterium endosymbiont of Bathymodiolus sp. 5 South]SHN92831.1 hypothetical protein BCLUESOX_112 [bacterium endosymbiont of Bathymodiolus sp. 5 South]VVH59994.1 hypothetical protein BSPCLSOX_1231 [uncultured Gammaproteobacteria bacterium]VVH63857.1 hypothetical protein BSPWISOX_3017 [uncultured Gammaproteobacteria bacterium]